MRGRWAAGLAAVLLVTVGVGTARAQGTASERAAVGEGAWRGADGLWRVRVADGRVLTTHGPDPRPDHRTTWGPGSPERAPVCADSNSQQVLYGRPSRSADRLAAVKADLQAMVRRMNALLSTEALESGSRTADYKVACEASGQISVGSFTHKGPTAFGNIVSSAQKAGFRRSDVDYTIFYDASHAKYCGTGNFANDDQPGEQNANNTGGDYGVTYVDCWFGRTAMHENGHNQGAVQTNAPDSTGTGHHCHDQHDVMCYAPDGGDRNQTEIFPATCTGLHFDCDHDTYFDAAPESGEWLSTHWNLGSAANRFIVLGPEPTSGGGLPLPPLLP